MSERAFTKSYDDIMRIANKGGITHLMKLVYCRLLRFTENNQDAFPSNSFLATEFGVSDRNIINAKNDLELIGVIKQKQRYNNSNVYTVYPWTNETPTPKELKDRGEKVSPSLDDADLSVEVKELHEGVKDFQGVGEKVSPLDVKELHTNKQSNIQLNKQNNRQVEIEVITSGDNKLEPHKEVIKEDSKSLSLPLSEYEQSKDCELSSPSIVTPQLAEPEITVDNVKAGLVNINKLSLPPAEWMMNNLKLFTNPNHARCLYYGLSLELMRGC